MSDLFVVGGVFLVATYGLMVADYIETVKGLDAGKTEIGPIAKRVVKKWGEKALPLFTFIAAAVVTLGAAVTGTMGGEYMLSFTGSLFAAAAVNNIRNIIKLRK